MYFSIIGIRYMNMTLRTRLKLVWHQDATEVKTITDNVIPEKSWHWKVLHWSHINLTGHSWWWGIIKSVFHLILIDGASERVFGVCHIWYQCKIASKAQTICHVAAFQMCDAYTNCKQRTFFSECQTNKFDPNRGLLWTKNADLSVF